MKKIFMILAMMASGLVAKNVPTEGTVAALGLTVPSEAYDSTRTFLVDNKNGNYLVRGNQPLNPDGTFAYAAISATLNTLIGASFDMTKYRFIDVSLISNTDPLQRGDLADEFAAYGATAIFNSPALAQSSWPPFINGKVPVTTKFGTLVAGKSGSLVWYPVQGCVGPTNCGQVEAPQYGFSQEVDFLRSLLTSTAKSSTVVYIHCTHGHDRTSALTAGYMMKYMGLTFDQAIDNCPSGQKFKSCISSNPVGAHAFSHCWEIDYLNLSSWYAGTIAQ